MMKRSIHGILMVMICSFCGLSCQAEKPDQDSLSKMINGDRDELAWHNQAIAMIRGPSMRCTGTFLTKRLLVTAAHCVIAGWNNKFVEHESWYSVYFPNADRNNRYTPKRIFLPEEYIKLYLSRGSRYPGVILKSALYGGAYFDVAILAFDEDVVNSPIPLSDESSGELKGREIRVLGYGALSRSYPSDECKAEDVLDSPPADIRVYEDLQIGINRVHEVVGYQVEYLGREVKMDFLTIKACQRPQGKNAIPGQGDSGGPMLANGRLLGIASLGGNDVASYLATSSEFFRKFYEYVHSELSKAE